MRSRQRPVGCNGFTLVELLVVLGIIAVLIGMLMPAVLSARHSAAQSQCASNLRQWANAFNIYAVENHGFLPRRGQGVGATTIVNRPADWFNALPPVLKMRQYIDMVTAGAIPKAGDSSMWICPSASTFPGTYYWSYGMNMGLSIWEITPQNNGLPDKISSVGNESIMVLLTDAPGNYCSIFPSKFPGGYNPAARHNKSVNVSFLDGHVSALPGSYIGVGTGMIEHPDIRWHPPGNTWNSAQ
jgi:prepilin-type N-terminal cleavage/methylation domain-containing protein/prepilin-type processing-associated H-X9-DG protein